MPGLSHRRPTSVTTVLTGMIEETLCIGVAKVNVLCLQTNCFCIHSMFLKKFCSDRDNAMNPVVDDITVNILRQYP